jgi:organic hydroperoxide reductase OsmC/OhrA
VPNEDGSQALTLKLGKRKVGLDAVKPKATRINASAEQVAAFTETLLAGVQAGAFDEAIKAVQAAAKQAVEDAKAKGTTVVTETGDEPELEANTAADIDGLDLDSLE